jgi:CheY-like chemotaxis protein
MDAPERAQHGRKHIFAINGAAEFLNLIRDLFEGSRYNITTTNFVPNSFAQVVALQPDVVIVDIAVGVQAGWELLERLHQDAATRDIPVVIISTMPWLLERAQAEAERYGFASYLAKPFDLGELETLVDTLIGPA